MQWKLQAICQGIANHTATLKGTVVEQVILVELVGYLGHTVRWWFSVSDFQKMVGNFYGSLVWIKEMVNHRLQNRCRVATRIGPWR